MRTILICCLGCLVATLTYAQDNLIFRNGTELSVKVLKVTPSELKYRRQDNPDGPIYTIGVTNLLLIRYANGTKDVFGAPAPVAPMPSATALSAPSGLGKLRYHRGMFSRYFVAGTGEPLSRTEVKTLLANQPDALESYQSGQALRKWGLITAIPAVALVGIGAGISHVGMRDRMPGRQFGTPNTPFNDQDRRFENGRSGLGIALAGGGVLLGVAALVLDHQATRQFRRAASRYNQHLQTVGLHFGPGTNSLGVGMKLTF